MWWVIWGCATGEPGSTLEGSLLGSPAFDEVTIVMHGREDAVIGSGEFWVSYLSEGEPIVQFAISPEVERTGQYGYDAEGIGLAAWWRFIVPEAPGPDLGTLTMIDGAHLFGSTISGQFESAWGDDTLSGTFEGEIEPYPGTE